MEIYKYIPPKIIKPAAILSGVCISAAAALLLLSAYVESFKGLYQLSCVIFAVVAIQLTTRYILSGYIFILDDINFIVVRAYGKKSAQVCNINLQTAEGISDKKSFADVEKELGKTTIVRNFCQNMFADEKYTCVFDFNGKKSAVIFDADIYFINEMKLRIEEAKLRYGE
jgi:hypothetical protein